MTAKIMQVRVADLQIDPTYQRIPTDKAIEAMGPFDPEQASIIEVSRRPDERMFVFDGGHRMLRARRDGVEFILAQVFDHLTVADEAARFVRLNTIRNRPKNVRIFNGRVVSEDPAALAIVAAVEAAGFHVATQGAGNKPTGHIEAVGALEAAYRTGGAALVSATVAMLGSAWPDDPEGFKAPMIHGCASLLSGYDGHPNFSARTLHDRLKRRSAAQVNQSAKTIAAVEGRGVGGGTAGTVFAAYGAWRDAMVGVYNSGAQNTIPRLTASDLKRLSLRQRIWQVTA